METFKIELTKDELLAIHGMTLSQMEFILKDVAKLSDMEGTKELRKFYLTMLLDCKSITSTIVKALS